jgi:hypothetical protein
MKTYKGKTENGKKIIKVSEGEKEYSLEYNNPKYCIGDLNRLSWV